MSPANQAQHESLLRRAAAHHQLAAHAREAAGYADSAQAREMDEKSARSHSQAAFDLEQQAAALMEQDP